MALTAGIHAPKLAHPESDDDPYVELVKAIVHRAVCDAIGQCSPTVSVPVAHLQADAQAWLSDDAQVAALLELTGLDSEPALRRIRMLLAATTPAAPLPEPPQLALFGGVA